MANKAISELPQALNVNNQDLFVLEQSGIAKKLTAETFITEQGIIDALAEALDGHGGISSVTLSSVSGRIRTYLITFTDETTTTFQVLDGTSIDRIVKTSTAGLVDTYTIFMSDGTTSFFQVTNGSKGDPGVVTDEQVTTAVDEWLDDNVTQETGYVLDRSLTMSNAAAPADLVGDLKSAIDVGSLTPEIKTALLACFENVAWINEDGQGYVNALHGALYNEYWGVTNNLTNCTTSNESVQTIKGAAYTATITASAGYVMTGATVSITMGGNDITSTAYSNGVISIPFVTGELVITITASAGTVMSISAVYTQGDTVIYTPDSLNILNSGLVVTATYEDSSTVTIPAAYYTLSGTLTSGTSTITVTFSGKTTTFTCTVSNAYQKCEYIEATGTQYIVLDNNFGSDVDGLSAVIECSGTIQSSTQGVISVNDSFGHWFGLPSSKDFGFGGTSYFTTVSATSFNTYSIVWGSDKATATSGNESIEREYGTIVSYGRLTLFAIRGSTSFTYKAKAKISSCQISLDGALIYDLVPCYHTSETVIGMYDRVNRTFFTNNGSGTFSKGSDV